MKTHSNAIIDAPETLLSPSQDEASKGATPQSDHRGMLWGLAGTAAFSITLPATRIAVQELDPVFVGLGRAVVAAMLAIVVLWLKRQPWPPRGDWRQLAIVALGVVIGFPLFSALAMTRLHAADAAVIVGLLPAATAVAAVLQAGERPGLKFWIAALAGLICILAFAVAQGAAGLETAHAYVLFAVTLAAIGYAEGGLLARTLGSWQVICWALVLLLPVVAPIALYRAWSLGMTAHMPAWLGFGYVSIFSMFLGFFAWYRGLALGGIARVGQIQLVQPLLTFVWSVLMLREPVTSMEVVAAGSVLACVVLTQRSARRARLAGTNYGAHGKGSSGKIVCPQPE